MPTTYKVLGQLNPAATTSATLYTVPSATQTVVSSIVVCNQAATSGTYRIAVRPNGATLANEHYIVYGSTVAANDSTVMTIGLTMDAADVVTVYSSSANMSFNLFGSEIA